MGAGQRKWDQPISSACVVGRHCKDWSRSAQSTAERVAATCAPRQPAAAALPSGYYTRPCSSAAPPHAPRCRPPARSGLFVCLCVWLVVWDGPLGRCCDWNCVRSASARFVSPPRARPTYCVASSPSSFAAHAVLHPCCVWPHLDLRHASVGRSAPWVGRQTRCVRAAYAPRPHAARTRVRVDP